MMIQYIIIAFVAAILVAIAVFKWHIYAHGEGSKNKCGKPRISKKIL